ncbi:unnamed protein product [Symbiodinium sp. CCMP2592]|nr:unnamed protein product [Symbiodinium sp. CCMP2592]
MQLPKACENASWLLVHTNASDFKKGSMEAPEYYGNAVACTGRDVVANALENGYEEFELEFLPAELNDTAVLQKPKALQPAVLKPFVRSCSLTASSTAVFGTLEDPEHFSLHPCECFGEAHSQTSPVLQSSDLKVPSSSGYNVGKVQDQQIFSGPYTCEDTAVLSQSFDTTLSNCASGCHANASCAFYQFCATSETCTLFERCEFVQRLAVQMVNDLYGIAPQGDFCRIADPDKCWKEIRRRSYLSLTPSDVPRCLFEDQYNACDALQQISGVEAGTCSRCEYINASSEYATKGMQKVPLPAMFPATSQISISCNYTTRMFSRQDDGRKWEGPRQSAIFTCVSGQWVGELGPWQYVGNLSCQES